MKLKISLLGRKGVRVYTIALFVLMINVSLKVNSLYADSFLVVDHVTAWPNLTVLSNGSILLVGFDQPSHGQVEGDVSAWISYDSGKTWQFQGRLTDHEPDTVRMNHAVGLTHGGDLIALVSGWSDIQQPDAPKRNILRDKILSPWICRSQDGGKTWAVHKGLFPSDPIERPLIPYGDIIIADDGSLRTAMYSTHYWDKPGPWAAFMMVSKDDGMTWSIKSKIAEQINETALLNLGGGKWLAAARSKHTSLFRSEDDGASWQNAGSLTVNRQFPAHLLGLSDGRIVLTFGDRREGHFGIGSKISSDEGETWSDMRKLASMMSWDGGYPASVELPDGRILTVYYSKKGELDDYAVFGTVWKP